MEKKRDSLPDSQQCITALDAAVEENLRLARELEEARAGTEALIELLTLLIETWKNGHDLEPVLDQVEEEIRRIRWEH